MNYIQLSSILFLIGLENGEFCYEPTGVQEGMIIRCMVVADNPMMVSVKIFTRDGAWEPFGTFHSYTRGHIVLPIVARARMDLALRLLGINPYTDRQETNDRWTDGVDTYIITPFLIGELWVRIREMQDILDSSKRALL